MKNILLAFSILFTSISFAQTHSFFYEIKFKKDSLSEHYDKDYYVLDISKDVQKFYNYEFYKNDSISKSRIISDYIFSYPKLDIRLIHKNGNEFYNYYTQTPLYYLILTNDKLIWEIHPEKKNFEKFSVQKATTKFGGREWEAWFTTEIPFQCGPYKFYGLPGLVLEVYDTKGNYIFSFKGNKNITNKIDTSQYIESQIGLRPAEISQKNWEKLQMDYFLNPLKDFGDGGLIVENERGEKVKANSREVILGQQNFLRKYNNPIELDKAIKYPEK